MSADKKDVLFLINQAIVKLTGASVAEIKVELFDALREFFTISSAWMEDIPVLIVPNTVEYTIVPSGGKIIRLAGVVDGNQIAQPAIMPTPGHLLFRSPYNNAASFTATVVKTVALPTDKDMIPDIPDWVLATWHEAILSGVLGRMMTQEKKPYTDEAKGKYHLGRFRDMTQDARAAALRRNTFGVQAWRFPQTFQTRGQRGGVSVGNDTRFR